MEKTKKKLTREELLARKRENERKRYEKFMKNPELYAEFRQKRKEKYQRRKQEGKVVNIHDLPLKEQKILRKKWQDESRRAYQRRKGKKIYVKQQKEQAAVLTESTTPNSSATPLDRGDVVPSPSEELDSQSCSPTAIQPSSPMVFSNYFNKEENSNTVIVKRARKTNLAPDKKNYRSANEIPSHPERQMAREIVGKVYDFMKSEALKNYAAKLTDARWRTAQAVQVSEKTVSRILKARRESSTKKIPEDPLSIQSHTNESAGESADTQMLVIVKTEEDEDDDLSLDHSDTYSCMTQTSPRPEEAVAWDQMPGPSDYPEVSKLKIQLQEQSTVIQKQAEKIEALDLEVNRLQARNQYLEELLKESGIPYDV